MVLERFLVDLTIPSGRKALSVATPLAAAYGASKFGLRGFSEALRAELAGHPGIHICDVYPSFVDTPGLTHGANYTGRSIGMPPGSHDPRRVADAIVRLAARPRPTTRIGPEVGLARFAHALAPNLLARMMARTMSAALSRAAPEGPSAGTLFVPPPRSDGITTGRRSPAERPALAAAALLTVLALATAAVALGRSRRG